MLEISVAETNFNQHPEQLAVVAEPDATLHRVQLQKFLQEQRGQFIGVDFVKQDGTCRKMNGRLGVYKHQKGGTNKVCTDYRPYISIFDVQCMEYRTLNLATVSTIRAGRKTYSIVG